MNFFIIRLKKNIITIILICFTISLLTFSKTNLESAKNGLSLWATSVLPSLFPFFIATELLYRSNFVNIFGKLFTKFMRPIFNVPGEAVIAFILGNISGYPTGAKLACNLKENNICTKIEAERLIAFTNNSGPLFILSTVGVSMFYNKEIGLLLLISHLLSSITVGIIFKNWKRKNELLSNQYNRYIQNNINYNMNKKYNLSNNIKNTNLKKAPNISLSNFGEILGESIKDSINLILTIGGFIVLFSVIISILNRLQIFETISNSLYYFGIPKEISNSVLSGILEVTNGLKLSSSLNVKNLSNNIIISSFILGFGGISVLFQVYSIISKHGISIKPYLYGKILQAFLSAFYTFLILQVFPNLGFPF